MMDLKEFRAAVTKNYEISPDATESLLNVITERFEGLTERYWKLRSGVTQTWQPEEYDRYLWFRGYPVINDQTFSLVTTYRWEYPNDSQTVLAANLGTHRYIMNWNRGILERFPGYRWDQYVVANYSCGLTPAQVPYEVRAALITQANFMLSRLSTDKIDISRQGIKDSSTVFLDPTYHPDFREVAALNRRRIHGING